MEILCLYKTRRIPEQVACQMGGAKKEKKQIQTNEEGNGYTVGPRVGST